MNPDVFPLPSVSQLRGFARPSDPNRLRTLSDTYWRQRLPEPLDLILDSYWQSRERQRSDSPVLTEDSTDVGSINAQQ